MPSMMRFGGPHERVPGSGGKVSKTVWRLFRFVFSNYKVSIPFVAICIIVTSLTTLTSNLFTKTLIDDYIVPMTETGSTDFSPLAAAMLRLGAILLVGIIASFTYNLLTVFIGNGTLRKLREELFRHMQKLPLSWFDSRTHGEIMSVYTNDVDTLRQVVSQSVPGILRSLVTIIATFTSMLVMSPLLSVISLLLAALMFYITRRLGTISKKYFTKRQENLGLINGFIQEMVTGQKVVKVYNHEENAMRQFAALNENMRSSVYNANRISNIIGPINANLGHFGYVLLAIAGAALALGGNVPLTLGTIVAFLTLQRNFNRPVSQISNEINSLAMASAGSDRVYAMLDEQPQKDEGRTVLEGNAAEGWNWKSPDGTLTPLKGLVSLQDVDFCYVADKQVLFDISLTAYPGQKIAFVGGTGAGKTTITNLINRFYEIQDGTICCDGIPVTDLALSSLRKSLGTVLQESKLFSGTIMENIRYGRLDATDEECRAAARLACADSFIRRMPNGYDTVLAADGGNLSQGERQLLCIARAAVADPPVLILDEATSSIDTRTEKLIQEGMASLMKGRTTFVIAHRLSTVQNADYIMVMDKGHIIERGKHAELLALKGKYYELYTGNQIV